MINAYGYKLYKTIENQRIICIGTIWGSPDKFLDFSRIMWQKLNSKWSLRYKVIEQAVTNYLIYHDKMFNESLIKSDNFDGFIMTLARTKITNIKLDSQNNILNGKGEIAAVIHQYDRKHKIALEIKKK